LVNYSLPIVLSICACAGVYLLYYLTTVFALRKKIMIYGDSL